MKNLLITISCVVLVALTAFGCGDDPVAPEITGNSDNGDGGGDQYVDVPAIPVPASPGGSVPKTSETLSKVEPLTSAFNPRVTDARGNWLQASYCGTQQLYRREFRQKWRSEVGSNWSIMGGLRRILFQKASGEREKIGAEHDVDAGQCNLVLRRRDIERFQGAALGKPVYIRRDRHWELKPIKDVGDFLLLDPNTQGEIASRYSQGVSNTETSEFGQSLTVEAGLGIGPLRASVSGTLSKTFSTAVEVTETSEREFTKTVWGEPGKQIQFMVWELVEVYTICDENGDAFEDPNYKITMVPLQRRGAALKLQATQFDQ